MHVNINLDTDNATDKAALLALAASLSGATLGTVYATLVATAEPTPETPSASNGDPWAMDTEGPEEPEETPAPVKRTRRTKAQMEADRLAALKAEEPEPEEEPEDADTENALGDDDAEEDDILGAKAPAEELTLDDAMEAAGELLKENRRSDIQAVLAKFKSERVSTLKPEQIGPFIAALKKLPKA